MSVNAMGWAGVCDVRGAGPSATAVLKEVAWRSSDAGDPNAARACPPVEIEPGWAACWAGVRAIARGTGKDEKTVRTVLRRLESAGVLRRQRRARHDGAIVRRVEDVILLNLAAGPVHLDVDLAAAEKKAAAGRAGAAAARAARIATAQPDEGASGHSARSVESASGHSARSVILADPAGASGHPADPPAGTLPERQRALCPGVVQDSSHDTRQDTAVALKSGTSPGLWTSPVDGDPAASSEPDPDAADDAQQLAAAAAALGNRKDRRLPAGTAWAPLRRLHPAAFEGLVERVLGDLVTAGQVAADWHLGPPGQHGDVWRHVRAAALREMTGGAAAHPPPTRHEEVA